MLQGESQDVAEAPDSTLPTTSAERVSLAGVNGGITIIDGKACREQTRCALDGSLTEILAKASDKEEHCRGKQLRLQPRA